jgi:3',5'-nucleoside bisphosphate phosphatase
MLRAYRADLHIHSILSPCTEPAEMSPRAIVKRSVEAGLDLIAVCDHNSCENFPALYQAALEAGLQVLAGMEITTREEIHILGLFDREADAVGVQAVVYEHLPGENDEKTFGCQVVVNEDEEVVSFNKKLLIGATTLSLEAVVDLIHARGGVTVASHIDREAYSIISQLGFVPPGLALDALEVSPRTGLEEARRRFPGLDHLPLISSSDAHSLDGIGGGSTEFLMASAGIDEIKLALAGREGRMVLGG